MGRRKDKVLLIPIVMPAIIPASKITTLTHIINDPIIVLFPN